MQVDNSKLNIQMDNAAIKVAQFTDGSYRSLKAQICLEPDTGLQVCSLLLEKEFNRIVDFDNHLDDISLDWLNPNLNEEIDSLAASFQ